MPKCSTHKSELDACPSTFEHSEANFASPLRTAQQHAGAQRTSLLTRQRHAKPQTRATAGFTLTELLVTVAIIVLLVSIAIPSLITYQKSIKLRTYDDLAYELYLVAQEELTNAKENGLLVDSYNEIVQDGTAIDAANHPEGKTGLYAISGDSFIPTLMGSTRLATLAQSGHFLIEVNPSSGQVYSVFYSETAFGQDDTTKDVLPSRKKTARLLHTPLLGYYQADANGLREATSELTSLKVAFVNEEELYLEITGDMDKLSTLYSKDTKLIAHSKISIELKDESKHTKQIICKLDDDKNEDGCYVKATANDFTVRILCDSMLASTNKKYDFQHLLSEFTPGENITAKVTFEYSNNADYVSESDSAASNSLFESNDGAKITVKTVRQLRNLSETVSGFEGNDAKDDVVTNAITQTDDIDFDNTDYVWQIGDDGAEFDEDAERPIETFTPIANTNFDSGSTTSFDGGNFDLKNFVVSATGNAGIVGTATGWTIKNANVVDPQITSTGTGSAGALVGSATSCTIQDCTTYISADHRSGAAASRTTDAAYTKYTVAGISNSGGLIGTASGGSVARCFASLYRVSSYANTGGLVGSASGTTFSGSYASQFTLDASTSDGNGSGCAGGFAGVLGAGSTATDCFAVTEWFTGDTTSTAAGFTADTSGSAEDCYALVGSVNTLESSQKEENRFGFAPSGDDGFAATDCYYYAITDFQKVAKTAAAGTSASVEEVVEKLEDVEAYTAENDGASFPYNTTGSYSYLVDDEGNTTYPALRTSALDYDGNWPDSAALRVTYDVNASHLPAGLEAKNISGTAPTDETAYAEDDTVTVLEGHLSYQDTDEPENDGRAIFAGWNTKADGTGTTYAAGDTFTITEDTTLYAVWVAGYHVTYLAKPSDEGVTGLPTDSNSYRKGATVTVLDQVPKRTNYLFLGWASSQTATEAEYTAGDTFAMGTADKKLYAVWKLAPHTVTANVKLDDSLASDGLDIALYADGVSKAPFSYVANTEDPDEPTGVYTASITNGTYEVYANGVPTGKTVTVNNDDPTVNLDLYTLKVKVTKDGSAWYGNDAPAVRKIVYSSDGTPDPSVKTFTPGMTQGVSTAVIVPSGTEWAIYLTDEADSKIFQTQTVSAPTTVEAKYYTMTYAPNDPGEGTVTEFPDPASKVYRTGTKVYVTSVIPEFKAEDGTEWGFTKWTANADGTGTVYEKGQNFEIEATTTLYAQWSYESFTVTYDKNANGATGTPPVDETEYKAGTQVTVKTNDGDDPLVRPEYNLLGWNTKADGTGTFYQEGEKFRITGDTTLYAQWSYDGTYTIIFDGNGASGGTTENTTFFDTASSVTLSPNRFVQTDSVFKGWATTAVDPWEEGQAESWTYLDEQVVTDVEALKALDTKGDRVIHLFAVWEEKPPTYTVTFVLDKMDKGNSSQVAYDKTEYTATLSAEGGYILPQRASEISVYVAKGRSQDYGSGTKLDALNGYSWDSYTGVLTIPAGAVTGNIKIVAAATPAQHTLTYYENTDESPAETKMFGEPEQHNYGEYFTLTDSTPTNGSKTFICWNTEAAGSGTSYQPGDVFCMTGDARLYAQWKQTDVVGAFIYNYYRYNRTTNDVSQNTNPPSSNTYGDHTSYQTYYTLMKGETQTMADGQTYEIIDNGGQPYVSSTTGRTSSTHTFTYGVFVPKDSASNYQFSYSTDGGGNYTTVTGTKGWSTLNNYSTDTRYPNGAASSGTAYNTGSYQYYYFTVTNSSDCVGPVTNIKIVDTTITDPNENSECIFDFENGKRPDLISSSAGSAPTTRTSDWSGITGAAPTISVHNGNVPTLDRSYANFFLNEDCQADFTVTPDENGYHYKGITLRNADDEVVLTSNNLITRSDGVITFKKEAMAELSAGTYTVTIDYDKDAQGTSYDSDPVFTLNVYDSQIVGYRYVRLNITGVDTVAENSNNVQFSEIGFASDEEGLNRYYFEDKAVMYDLSSTGSYLNEDAYLVMDNNTRTKMCEQSSSKNWTLLIDLGDGYQLNTNEYGYASYYTAGDTFGWGRSPLKFSYYGANNEDVVSTKAKATGTENWTKVIDVSMSETTSKGTAYNNCAKYAQNETLVTPDSNTYTLTYDPGYEGGSLPSGWSYNITKDASGAGGYYGEVTVCYETLTRDGYNFLGWSETKGATTADYTGGSTLNLIKDTTLYAVWAEGSRDLVVSYQVNAPAGTSADAVNAAAKTLPTNGLGTAGTAFTLSSDVPVLEGYRFTGWSWMIADASNPGSGTLVDIRTKYPSKLIGSQTTDLSTLAQPGDTIAASVFTQNVTLYANWEAAWRIELPQGDGFTVSTNEATAALKVGDYYYVSKDGSGTQELIFWLEPKTGWNVGTVYKRDGDVGTLTQWTSNVNKYTLTSVGSDVVLSADESHVSFAVTIVTDGSVDISGIEGFDPPAQTSENTWTASVTYGNSYQFTAEPHDECGIAAYELDEASVEAGLTVLREQGTQEYTVGGDPGITQNCTVTFATTTEKNTITYHAGTGTGTMEAQEFFAGALTTLDECTFTAPEGAEAEFAGWSLDEDATTIDYTDKAEVVLDADTDLYAVWRSKVTVTFMSADGTTEIETWVGSQGTAAETPDVPDATHGEKSDGSPFHFEFNTVDETGAVVPGKWISAAGGWGSMPTGAEEVDLSNVVEDLTVYALYSYKTYTISFVTFDGCELDDMTYNEMSESFNLPNEETHSSLGRRGYTFEGWTGDGLDTPTKDVRIAQSSTDGDKEYTGHWTAKTFGLTLDRNGGTGGSTAASVTYDSDEVSAVSPETALSAPTRTDADFLGWSSVKDGGELVIVWDAESGTASLAENAAGYTQDGAWAYDFTGSAVTLYAKWQLHGYNLTLKNGKSGAVYNEFVEYGATSLEGYSTPTRSGWTLEGWYTENSLTSGTKVLNADGSIAAAVEGYTTATTFQLSEDKTLYARWSRPRTVYTLTNSLTSGSTYVLANVNAAGGAVAYAPNGGTNAYENVTVQAGTSQTSNQPYIELGSDQSNAEFTYTSNSYLQNVNSNRYLHATTSNWRYSGFDMSTSSTAWTYTSNNLRTSEEDYYGFGSYEYVYFNGTTLGYTRGDSASSNKLYLYAEQSIEEYSLNNEITVTLDYNDGSGNTATTLLTPASGSTTVTFTFPVNPTRANETRGGRTVHYVFAGWGTDAYMAGDQAVLSDDATYVAQWTAYAEKTVFKKVTTLTAGNTYVIATNSGKRPIINNSNSVGTGTAVSEQTATGTFYTESGGTFTPVDSLTYIENPANNYQWNYTSDSYLQSVSNTNRYLRHRSNNRLDISTNTATWTMSGSYLKAASESRYLSYNNNFSLTGNTSGAAQMVLYEKTTVYELYTGE